MSQGNDYAAPRSPLPPPPPLPLPPQNPPHLPQAPDSPGIPGQQRAQQQTSPVRRIAVQPPLITTALAPPQGNAFLHTPASATSLSVPFSSYAPSPSTYAASPVSSPMTMRTPSSVPYNPQQWGRQGLTGGVHVPHSVNQAPAATARGQEMTGMEGNSNFFNPYSFNVNFIARTTSLNPLSNIGVLETCLNEVK
jgi:hypothetical protein